MEGNEISKRVTNFISKYAKTKEIAPDQDIFKLGFNSLFAMQLILYLEKEFDIVVDNNSLVDGSLNSIDNIVSFIQKAKVVGING